MVTVINERMVKYWLSFDFLFRFTRLYKIAKECGFERSDTLSDYLMNSSEDSFIRNEMSPSRSAVDLLYKIRDRVEYEEIKGEVDTLLVAVNYYVIRNYNLLFKELFVIRATTQRKS